MGGWLDSLLAGAKRSAEVAGKASKDVWNSKVITNTERVLTENASQAVPAALELAKKAKMVGEQRKGELLNHLKGPVKEIMDSGNGDAYNDFHAKGLVPADAKTGFTAIEHKNIGQIQYSEAKAIGIPVRPLVTPNYFPRLTVPGAFDTEAKRQAMVESLVKRGKAADANEAMELLGFMKGSVEPFYRTNHSLESSRWADLLDPAVHRQDAGVFPDYLLNNAETLGQRSIIGGEGQVMSELLSTILKVDGPAKYTAVRKAVANTLGATFIENPEWYKRTRAGLAQAQLGLATVSNTGSGIANMMALAGGKNFVEGMARMASDIKGSYDWGDFSGAVTQRGITELRRITKAENQSLLASASAKVLMNPGETLSRNERWMRVLGSVVGKTALENEFAALLANPSGPLATATRRRLNVLGVDVDGMLRRGVPSQDDYLKASYTFANKAMQKPSALDLPSGWTTAHPAVRLLTMYKPYLFMQSRIIKDEILKPALAIGTKFDPRPLMWFMLAFPSAGELAGDIKMVARGRSLNDRPDFNKYPFDRIVDNMSQLGAFGVINDVTSALASGSPVQTYQFISGPAYSTAVDFATLFRMTSSKAQADALARQRSSFFLRKIPVIGPAVSEAVNKPQHRPGKLQQGVITKGIQSIFR